MNQESGLEVQVYDQSYVDRDRHFLEMKLRVILATAARTRYHQIQGLRLFLF
jgi:hypothetical protein